MPQDDINTMKGSYKKQLLLHMEYPSLGNPETEKKDLVA